jgi:predicted O-methyltransferase YrrM
VVDPTRDDKATVAIRNFNAALATDPRVEFSIVPIGDGVTLCRKL